METLILAVALCIGLGLIPLASHFGLTKDWEKIFLHIYFFLRRKFRTRKITAQTPSRGPSIQRRSQRADRTRTASRSSPRTAPHHGAPFRPRIRVSPSGTRTYNTVPRVLTKTLRWTCDCTLCAEKRSTQCLTVGCHKCSRPHTEMTFK